MAQVQSYDLIVIGTGFASSFFLHGFLKRLPENARVLVLERGRKLDHAWQVEHRSNSDVSHTDTFRKVGLATKSWNFTIGFGGSSNCWSANTPRMLPNDFRMKTLYGVGYDWPVSYDDLASYYDDVEDVMSVSGPRDAWPFPRTKPYPQPPHRMTEPDRLLQAKYPDAYFVAPTARASVATGNRNQCCANGVCTLCPVDAKFTILNGMSAVYSDPRVEVFIGAEALSIDIVGGNTARGVHYQQDGQVYGAKADLVVLGANAIFNPFLMLKSGVTHPLLGRRLNERAWAHAYVHYDGVDGFSGSTVVTGHGYMFYDGPHRAERGGILIEGYNAPPVLRREFGKWRQAQFLKFCIEEEPDNLNRVEVDPENPSRPVVTYNSHSEYALASFRKLPELAEQLFSGLPVEKVIIEPKLVQDDVHIQGTVMMGADRSNSVVDDKMRCHFAPNLIVLGSSAFPTCPPANPTLTLSALALRSAALI
jgi:choline dehydrogenase-like flavoprotein